MMAWCGRPSASRAPERTPQPNASRWPRGHSGAGPGEYPEGMSVTTTSRTPRLSVIGTGYLGATHAACMADLGFEVVGVDVDPAKVAMLAAGTVPFYEPGLPEVLQRALASGRLRFTTSVAEAASWADVHFVCTGTPQLAGSHAADLSQVHGAVQSLSGHLRPGSLVVGKSTVPVGTADAIATMLDGQAEVAWNPEFLREGFAVADTMHPDRLVIGVRSSEAEQRLREVYRPITDLGIPLLVMDFATAELVKVAANAFLATKISFINAMAEVCEAAGADVTALADAIGHDPRIGRRFLAAGLGFGGGCLPKDIRAFMARAGELGAEEALTFLREVDSINLRRRSHTVDLAKKTLGGALVDRRITVLGAAFKPDSDDVRDSPALDVAQALSNAGAHVIVHDPRALDNAARVAPTLHYEQDVARALAEAELVLHLTEWAEYRDLDPKGLDRAPGHLIDGRNCLDPARWRAAGWSYRALGRPHA